MLIIPGVLASANKISEPAAGYSLWLDAADPTVFTYSSGTVVSQWTDKSANGYQFTQSVTAAQPSRSGTQNGKSTVVFDGSNDTLYESTKSRTIFKYLHDGTGATVFFVKKLTSTSAVEMYVLGTATEAGGTQTGTYTGGHYPPSSNAFYGGTGRGVTGAYVVNDTGTYTNNTWEVRTFKLDQNNATAADKMVSYLNTGSAISSTANNFTSGSTGNSSGWLGIGSTNNGTDVRYFFNGEIAEILFYTSVLGDSSRLQTINYLKSKWGI